MVVIMVGLPGTGKSTLARSLAQELGGLVIDKDKVRAALFSGFVDYTREQDDLTMECVYMAARYAARKGVAVFVDGRAFAGRDQWERALELVREAGVAWAVIETECSDEKARERIAAAATTHPAANRTFELYLSLRSARVPVAASKLIVNTDQPVAVCLTECLEYIRARVTSPYD